MSTPALRLDHLALPVFDVASTYHFYSEVLQFPLVDVGIVLKLTTRTGYEPGAPNAEAAVTVR